MSSISHISFSHCGRRGYIIRKKSLFAIIRKGESKGRDHSRELAGIHLRAVFVSHYVDGMYVGIQFLQSG